MARDDWNGAFAERGVPRKIARVTAILEPNDGFGVACAFQASTDSGGHWWVKPPNSPQGPKSLANEWIVAQLGGLLGAPVCEVEVATVDDDLVGELIRVDPLELRLAAGLCTASRHIEGSMECRHRLENTHADNNAIRHAGILALYDWCWGRDPQWLTVAIDDHATFSHDHGLFFGGANWSAAALRELVDAENIVPVADGRSATSPAERSRIAELLRGISRAILVPILRRVPREWVPDPTDLEELGYFLERRAVSTADRLER